MKQRAFLAIGTIVLCAGLLAGCGKITKSVEINYGETYKIEDEKLEGKENLTWESADAEIVEVADDGTVTAKAPGKAKVAIKENGKSVGEYANLNYFLKMDNYKETKGNMNADLVTQAVHEKLGY